MYNRHTLLGLEAMEIPIVGMNLLQVMVEKELALDPDHQQREGEPGRRHQPGPALAPEETEQESGETEPLGHEQPLPEKEAGKDSSNVIALPQRMSPTD